MDCKERTKGTLLYGNEKRDRSMIIMGNRRRDYIGNGKIDGTTTLHGGSSDVKDVC